jgi:hypothetical protein
MTANAASAVNAETTGAMMYGASIAAAGKKLSFRISLIRSAIGCSSPNGPARFGPYRSCIRPITLRSISVR